MKLLSRISLNYVWLTLSVLLVSGFLLYGFLYVEISTEIKEQLELQQDLVTKELEAGRAVRFPLVKADVVSSRELMKHPVFKDTLVYDNVQKEMEGYYLLRQSKIIHGKIYLIQVMTTHIGWGGYSKTIGYMFLFIAAMLIVFGTLVNYFVNRKILKPFILNLDRLQSFSVSSGEDLALMYSKIDEFSQLNAVMSALASKAQGEYRVLKEFTENASHEIQTPLSIIQSRLERISQHQVDEQVAGFIQDAKVAVNRLSRVNKGLLLLAKIENKSFPDQIRLDLESVLLQHTGQLEDLFAYKNISLKITSESKWIEVSASLMDVLISNLVSNLLNHSAQGAASEIYLHQHKLEFKNSGSPLGFDQEKLFVRFGKGGVDYKGNGLGLPIVKLICNLYGWDFSYSYVEAMHVFRITFP